MKTFCITLKEHPHREKITTKEFEKHGVQAEFFYGVDGKKFGLRSTIPYMDDNPTGPEYFIYAGQIGCILSHVMLWKTLQHLPYDEILILEDDVILCDDFVNRFKIAKDALPNDWEFVFVGHCCLPSEEYLKKINDHIIDASRHPPMCTHAYLVKKSALQTLIDTNNIAWSHIDIQIHKRSLPHLKNYVMMPPLIDQMSIHGVYEGDYKSLTVDWGN